jgi:hypothetical protein
MGIITDKGKIVVDKFYKTAKKRGGTDAINRYKINPIFFV